MKYRKIIIIAIPVILLLGALSYNFWFAKSASRGTSGRLVGWWTMDSNDINGTTYYDKSGFGNNATSTGSPTIATGKINQALGLTGTQYIGAVTNSKYNFVGGGSLSVWVKENTSGNYNIVGNGNNIQTLGGGWSLDVRSDVGIAFKQSCTDGVGDYLYVTPSTVITAVNQWKHIVITYNSSAPNTSPVFYVDGVAQSLSINENCSTNVAILSSGNVGIGKAQASISNNMNGVIDDVRIYNYALSAQEVANLYSSAKINYVQAPSRTAATAGTGRLVGYWTMDTNDMSPTGATMYDKSGFNNTGTVTGTTTSTGRIGQARTFNGISNVINVANESNFDFTTAFTLSGWIKAKGSNFYYGVIAKGDGGDGWDLILHSGRLRMGLRGTSQIDNSGVGNDIRDDKWHYFTIVNTTSNIKTYVDNVMVSSYNGTWTATTNNTLVQIGDRQLLGTLDGSLDDVRIYNYALSAAEVANLYSSAKVNYISAPSRTGLVGYWTMDANDMSATGATLYDKSGKNNNGTVTGTTTSTGRIGQARSFNGSSDFIDVGNNTALNVGTGDVSFSAWVKPANITGGEQVLGKRNFGGLGTTNGYLFGLNSGQARILIENSDGDYVDYSTGSVSAGAWRHIAATITRGSATGAKLFIDGVQVGTSQSTSLVQNSLTNATNLAIGRQGGDIASGYFNGAIDDVRIYNYALSAQEVANLYSSAKINYIK
ncbi:MAG: LamG domain-containing protein [bacterium]